MIDGWYYRSLAKEEEKPTQGETTGGKTMENMEYESRSDEDHQDINASDQNVTSSNKSVDYKSQFRFLKRKLKFLIYENEFFQDALRSNQRRLLKVSRDRAFLLDRLLQYEKPENTSSESDDTDSSEEETKDAKKRKIQESLKSTNQNDNLRGRKKLFKLDSTAENISNIHMNNIKLENENTSTLSLGAEMEIEDEQQGQGHMSAAEVERHLKSKKIIDLLPERAPATVPTEMFSIDGGKNSVII